MSLSPRRWNRTTLTLISYGVEARTPDSSGRHYKLVVCAGHFKNILSTNKTYRECSVVYGGYRCADMSCNAVIL
ncbi:hypothetical protein CDAR_373091 [Caerostris darwini]|uniref:Uncharacterized protein n=1 Tax=Caerostris darwini TaxID=1538125 RepID=A0AAV4X863_9ARAC|nr:hypothetical protein CDAR_373091 [Caerostris darwini]